MEPIPFAAGKFLSRVWQHPDELRFHSVPISLDGAADEHSQRAGGKREHPSAVELPSGQ